MFYMYFKTLPNRKYLTHYTRTISDSIFLKCTSSLFERVRQVSKIMEYLWYIKGMKTNIINTQLKKWNISYAIRLIFKAILHSLCISLEPIRVVSGQASTLLATMPRSYQWIFL